MRNSLQRYWPSAIFLVLFLSMWFLFVAKAYASQQVILGLANRTATTTTASVIKTTEQRVHFILNVTAAPGGQTLTPEVDAQDALGNWYPLLNVTAINSTGVTIFKVGPGIGAVSGGTAPDYVPDIYRVKITHSAGGTWTYSLTENYGQ